MRCEAQLHFDDTARAQSRGAILIVVLLVVSSLSLLSLGLAHRVRLSLKIVQFQTEELQAYHLALGGLRRVKVALLEDDNAADFPGESWSLNGTAAEESFFQSLDRETTASWSLHYTVSDEESRLNINRSAPIGWLELPGMDENILYTLLDWQDEDDQPHALGAERDQYLNRLPRHRAKDAPLTMIEEWARLLRPSSMQIWGEDRNGNRRLDPQEDDGAVSGPADDADGQLDLGLVDYFTVYGNGRVNINTAPAEVLAALPGVSRPMAEGIVEYRHRQRSSDQPPFATVADLARVAGLNDTALEILEEYGTVRSAHFRTVVEARVGRRGSVVRLRAQLRRRPDRVEVIYLQRG